MTMMIRSTITLTENKPSKVTTNLEGQSGMQEGLENGKAATPPHQQAVCGTISAYNNEQRFVYAPQNTDPDHNRMRLQVRVTKIKRGRGFSEDRTQKSTTVLKKIRRRIATLKTNGADVFAEQYRCNIRLKSHTIRTATTQQPWQLH